jgi:hypothetical protein
VGDPRKTAIVLGGSLGVTALLVLLSLGLGNWAFRTRSGSLHDGRLKKALAQQPRAEQLHQALLAEGGAPVAPPSSDDELRRLAPGIAPVEISAIASRRRRWPRETVFAVPGALYFVYFAEDGTMRDYVVVPR